MAQEKQDILVAKLMADISSFKKGMDEATNKANKSAGKLSKTFAKVGNAMKVGLAVGVAYLGYNAINTIKDFEQGVANLAAVTGQTTKEIAGLTNNALQLGRVTAYTATEVTGLQTELAKLGFREKDIINLTKPILDLAQATGSDLANAAALAGSVVKSFGLDASQTTDVVDVMTKSFSESALDIGKFEVGIRQVAPVAKTAGVELSEVTAILGILANNGVRAESAGVGLRNILLESAKRGKPYLELLNDINISTDKAKTAMELFGKENAAAAIIVAENSSKINELNESLLASAGTADQMAKTQINTLTGKITLLASAWDGFVLSIEEGTGTLAKFTKGAIEGITDVLELLSGSTVTARVSLERVRKDLKKEIEVLNSSNLSLDAKKRVLERINREYGEYLPALLTEETSLEDIVRIGDEANKNLRARISLEKQEKELVEEISIVSEAKNRIVKNQIKLEGIRASKVGKSGKELRVLEQAEVDLMWVMQQEEFTLEENTSKLTALIAERQNLKAELASFLPIVVEETTVVDDNTAAVDDNTKALEYNAAANEAAMKANEDRINAEIAAGIPDFEDVFIPDDIMGDSITDEMKLFDEQLMSTAEKSAILAAGIQSSFSAISGAIMGSVSEAETGMGRFLRALAANAIEIIGVNLAQSMANVITGATQSGTATGPAAAFTTPAFIATAIGGIIGAFASIPQFATGGIVGGSSFSGDRVMARVNSGEMILNGGQQNRLFNMINGGNGGGGERLVTKLQGQDILVAIERADNKRTRKRGF